MEESSADQEIRKSNMTVCNLWKIWRPTPNGTGSYDRLAVWHTTFGHILKFLKLIVDQNIQFSTLLSRDTALFQQLRCISNTFFKQTLLQGVVLQTVKFCKILWSHIDPYYSLLPQWMMIILACHDKQNWQPEICSTIK